MCLHSIELFNIITSHKEQKNKTCPHVSGCLLYLAMSTFRVSIVDHSILKEESQWPVGNVQRTTMICCSLKGKMCRHSHFTLTGCYEDPKSIMLGSHCQQTHLPLDISMRQIVHNDVNMNKPALPWCSHCEPCYLRIPQSYTVPSATRKRHSSPTDLPKDDHPRKAGTPKLQHVQLHFI